MQCVSKQDGKYADISWDEFKNMREHPPTDGGAALTLQSPGVGMAGDDGRFIAPTVQDWWLNIFNRTENIEQFINDLIELFKGQDELYNDYRQRWKFECENEFQTQQSEGSYLPDDKHALFVESVFGHSSKLMEVMKSGIASLVGQLDSPRGTFRSASIFAELGEPLSAEGDLTNLDNEYLPGLKLFYNAFPDNRDAANNRAVTILREDFCGVMTKAGVFDFNNNLEWQLNLGHKLLDRAREQTYRDVVGTKPQDRMVTNISWEDMHAGIEHYRGMVDKGTLVIEDDEEPPVVPEEGPGPSKKRKAEKSVTFAKTDHPKDEKKEESTWIWALGFVAAAFVILR